MFENPYYHEIIKKATIGFGALFSRIKIIRRNQAGVDSQVISVPIAFGPKEKIITRLEQDPELTGHTYITLPRMAFEITGYNYDPDRKMNRNNKILCFDNSTVTATYTPVPYNLEFQLSILTKGKEDGLAIIEQILPLFTPEYSFTINVIPELNIKQDVPVILNAVDVVDDYEGDFATRRLVTHTLSFTLKINLFGSIKTGKAIQRTDTDIKKFQNHVATMDNDGNIIVDTWVQQSREDMRNVLAGSASTTTTTSGSIAPELFIEAAIEAVATHVANLDVQEQIEIAANVDAVATHAANLDVQGQLGVAAAIAASATAVASMQYNLRVTALARALVSARLIDNPLSAQILASSTAGVFNGGALHAFTPTSNFSINGTAVPGFGLPSDGIHGECIWPNGAGENSTGWVGTEVVPQTSTITIYFTADNYADAYVQGVKVATSDNWAAWYTVTVDVIPGAITAVDFNVFDAGAAYGMAGSIYDGNGTLLASSNTTWVSALA